VRTTRFVNEALLSEVIEIVFHDKKNADGEVKADQTAD